MPWGAPFQGKEGNYACTLSTSGWTGQPQEEEITSPAYDVQEYTGKLRITLDRNYEMKYYYNENVWNE